MADQLTPLVLTDFAPGELDRLIQGEQFFWLDLVDPPNARLEQMGTALDLHPLAIEDVEHFGQRAKIDDYGDTLFIVFYGAAPADDDDRLVEVNIFFNRQFLITVRRDHSQTLDELRDHYGRSNWSGPAVLHRVLDALVDSFPLLLDELDVELEAVEAELFNRQLDGQDREIHSLSLRVTRIIRVTNAELEVMIKLRDELIDWRGLGPEVGPYFRDVEDHLLRVTETATMVRDRAIQAMQIYLAAVSNRANEVMQQFTVIAGIFLPLAFIVGFFGQNFKWMTDAIEGPIAFWVLGFGISTATAVGLWLMFRRRGLLR